jgi:mono/diheme cytochrome c family protein
MRWLVLAGALLVAWSAAVVRATSTGGAPAAAPVAVTHDELAERAYAILKKNCFECHAQTRSGGLDMRTHESLRKGGANGPVIVPHEPEKSRLYRRASHTEQPGMPLRKDKLSEEDLQTLFEWIDAGGSLEDVPEARPEAAAKSLEVLAKLEQRPITDAERQVWAFQLPKRAPLPAVTRAGWDRNPIDAFLLSAMTAKGLRPSARADRASLIRRAYLDVLGLPPAPEEVDAFVKDTSPAAWAAVVDRLLASRHYGERWARHWMDLVRYADSGGYEFDVDRPEMYRYRDYLIASFNNDKPYSAFVQEQLAGDEIAPDSEDAMIATGFLRLGPEGGGSRYDQLDDLITTTTLTFTGLTVGCARCHNHKFDPIAQRDYYRLQAVFFSTRNVEHPLSPAAEVEANRKETQRVDALVRPLRTKKTDLEKPYLKVLVDREIAKLPDYLQAAWNTPAEQRTAGQKLNVTQIERTLQNDTLRGLIKEADIVAIMPGDVKAQHAALKTEIEAIERQRPRRLPTARAIGESGREARPSFFLHRGSPDAPGTQMTPGVPSVLVRDDWAFPTPPADAKSSWRRRGYAEWLTSPANPLTARVMVNRLWQHHFGEGIVRTPSNFGRMGEPPTHPELLDWLAVEFMDRGWSLKTVHRLMLTSEAYQMRSEDVSANLAIDPENRYFWRMPRVRLEAEIIRDQMLAAAGTLDRTLGGPAIFPFIDPDLFEKSSKRDWPGRPDSDPSTWRRSIYVFSKRSIRYPMFEAFDQPNLVNSADRRNRTTIAPQALILMNNRLVLTHAAKFAERLRAEAGDDPVRQVDRAFRLTLARLPDVAERQRAVAFVRGGPGRLAEFCHLLFNLNEFLYRP